MVISLAEWNVLRPSMIKLKSILNIRSAYEYCFKTFVYNLKILETTLPHVIPTADYKHSRTQG